MSERSEDSTTPTQSIVDLSEVRAQKMEEKRRKTERIFFQQILGIYTVSGSDKLHSIDIVDVSEHGLSFQIRFDPNNTWPNESTEFPVRLYFSQDTYLPIYVKIQNSRSVIDEGTRYIRYGCAVDSTSTTYETFRQFIRFMKLYAENAHKDGGEVKFFY